MNDQTNQFSVPETHPLDFLLCQLGHELRSPLAAALLQLSTAERLLTPLDAKGDALASLVEARRAVAVLDRMIGRTLDVQGKGRATIRRERVDLAELVEDVVDRLAASNPSASTLISTSVPLGSAGLFDRTALEEIIDNLLSNALKFGEGRPVRLRLDREGDGVRLEVRDLGAGMPMDEQVRVFDPFVRGASSAGIPGFGLGLWIVGRLVEAHDGQITVHSRPEHGTSFEVFLRG
jgi:signal transduction histidine kinase